MATVIIHSDFRAQENKSVIVSTFSPSIYHEVRGLNIKISIFFFWCWVSSQFFHSLSPSSRCFLVPLSVIRVVSSAAYLRLMIFLSAILFPAYDSSSPAFFIIFYSAYKLNKQGDYIQPCCIPFSILTSQLFHVRSWLLLLDLRTGFSGDR